MRAIINLERKPGRVVLEERRIPEIGESDVLLRVRGVGVCGSDLHQWHASHSWPVNYPVILGHEFAGEVAATGKAVQGFHEGDRVTSETAAYVCGECAYCRTARYNLCPRRLGFGYGLDGAMADYVRVPGRCLHRIPEGVPWEDAAMTEPACVAANALLELSTIRPGDFVVILGPGPIGLMALQMARLGSPSTLWMIGTASDRVRLSIARELGAARTLVTGEEDVLEAAREIGDGFGPDLVVDATGVSAAMEQALQMVRPAGQITKIGWGRDPLNCSLDPIVQKAVRIQGTYSHTWATWERVLGLMAGGQLRLAPMRRLFPLDRWRDAFLAMDRLEVPKSVLTP